MVGLRKDEASRRPAYAVKSDSPSVAVARASLSRSDCSIILLFYLIGTN